MPRIVELPVALCTAQSFAPYGQVFGLPDGVSQHRWSSTRTWSADFAIDGEMEVMYARAEPLPWEFTKAECHFAVTQTFIPLGDSPVVMAFAAPTGNAADGPAPEDFRAFYIPGNRAVMMYRGVWHSGRFMVRPQAGEFIILTDAHTTRELQSDNALRRGKLTHIVHYDDSRDTLFRLTDPQGVAGRSPPNRKD